MWDEDYRRGYGRGPNGKRCFFLEERLYVRGKYHSSGWFGSETPDGALNSLISRAEGRPLELKNIDGA